MITVIIRSKSEFIFADPAFQTAMQETLTRLQDGSAVWHTYDEVFSE
jgi:hypothetical protein